MHWKPPFPPNASMLQALTYCAHEGGAGVTGPETEHTVFQWQLPASGPEHETPLLISTASNLQTSADGPRQPTKLAGTLKTALHALQVMGIHTAAELRLQALPDLCTRFGARVGHLLHNASRGLVGLGLAVYGVVAWLGMIAWLLLQWLLTVTDAQHVPAHTVAILSLVMRAQ